MRIELGQPVDCSDGPFGTVGDVVIDPRRRSLTHVVVEPHGSHHLARLVPIADFDGSSNESPMRVRCTAAELVRYPDVEETSFLRFGDWPPLDGDWEVGATTVLSLPFYDGPWLGAVYAPSQNADGMLMTFDRIPAGEVELRRDSTVEASGGHAIGHAEGLLVDADGVITHLVLERGHLWGRRDITIPVEAIKQLHTDRVELRLTAAQVGSLPAVRVRRRHSRV